MATFLKSCKPVLCYIFCQVDQSLIRASLVFSLQNNAMQYWSFHQVMHERKRRTQKQKNIIISLPAAYLQLPSTLNGMLASL